MPLNSPFKVPNVRRFIAFRIFFNSRFYYPIFTILFLDFGLTVDQFALLNAVWAGTIVLSEVPSGALADIIGRRRLLVFTGALMVAEMAIIALVPIGNTSLVFGAFLVNRILSGLAEAAASGADEALAYDALEQVGLAGEWGRVLETQMRCQSVGFILSMVIGAAIYDPHLVAQALSWIGVGVVLTQTDTLRWPLYLTLVMGILTLITALRMDEARDAKDTDPSAAASENEKPVAAAFRLTLKAGGWILKTPWALAIILFGLLFDGIIRMAVTLSSQYYRIILIPEALFGVIGALIAALGLFVPRLARRLSETRRPAVNLALTTLVALSGLTGMAFCWPYVGLLPAIVLSSAMFLKGFFISHYLNAITTRHQRATVLSFKGLSFNLCYGLLGILYSLLVAALRGHMEGMGLGGDALEDAVFTASLAAFPWTFVVGWLVVAGFVFWYLRRDSLNR
ncbi:MAG: MFS transporter [Desulfosarcinaceae bacterium]|jgi:MFS family permease